MQPFTYLLSPFFLSSRNRARQWERGDLPRGVLFGGVALGVCGALFYGAFWLTTQLLDYEELGDFLLRIGLSWLLFAASIVLLVRFVQPERLLRVDSLPDVTDFFATLQSPITPMLPSFWAGETLFSSLVGGRDLLHAGALWMTAAAFTVLLAAAGERW